MPLTILFEQNEHRSPPSIINGIKGSTAQSSAQMGERKGITNILIKRKFEIEASFCRLKVSTFTHNGNVIDIRSDVRSNWPLYHQKITLSAQ